MLIGNLALCRVLWAEIFASFLFDVAQRWSATTWKAPVAFGRPRMAAGNSSMSKFPRRPHCSKFDNWQHLLPLIIFSFVCAQAAPAGTSRSPSQILQSLTPVSVTCKFVILNFACWPLKKLVSGKKRWSCKIIVLLLKLTPACKPTGKTQIYEKFILLSSERMDPEKAVILFLRSNYFLE